MDKAQAERIVWTAACIARITGLRREYVQVHFSRTEDGQGAPIALPGVTVTVAKTGSRWEMWLETASGSELIANNCRTLADMVREAGETAQEWLDEQATAAMHQDLLEMQMDEPPQLAPFQAPFPCKEYAQGTWDHLCRRCKHTERAHKEEAAALAFEDQQEAIADMRQGLPATICKGIGCNLPADHAGQCDGAWAMSEGERIEYSVKLAPLPNAERPDPIKCVRPACPNPAKYGAPDGYICAVCASIDDLIGSGWPTGVTVTPAPAGKASRIHQHGKRIGSVFQLAAKEWRAVSRGQSVPGCYPTQASAIAALLEA